MNFPQDISRFFAVLTKKSVGNTMSEMETGQCELSSASQFLSVMGVF